MVSIGGFGSLLIFAFICSLIGFKTGLAFAKRTEKGRHYRNRVLRFAGYKSPRLCFANMNN